MMIWISRIVAGLIGLTGGMVISAAVFALITSTGMMTRLAGRTNTGNKVLTYETSVILGGTIFNLVYVYILGRGNVFLLAYDYPIFIPRVLLLIQMLFSGMFVGCLAVSLSEAIQATAVFARRVKLRKGMCFVVLSVALGKMIAVFIQFFVM